ncbi:Phosphoinositide phosphatase SAC1, partial [Cucurbita argyrosperma subsp. argyrosperma]
MSRYLAMTSIEEANGWYGGTLLGDQDESSEIYTHYSELCEGPAMMSFQNDPEREKHYADLLRMGAIDVMDNASIDEDMEAALKEYDEVGVDLGIIPSSCKYFAEDPSWLTRWIIGEEKLQRI